MPLVINTKTQATYKSKSINKLLAELLEEEGEIFSVDKKPKLLSLVNENTRNKI